MEYIQLEPYPPQMVAVFSREQHEQVQKDMDLPDFGHWDEPETRSASTFTFERANYPYRLMVLEFYHPDELKYNSISHEGIHVMSALMKYVGLTYDVDNDEWYAYQHDFIVNAVCRAHDAWEAERNKPAEKPRIETGNHPVMLAPPQTLAPEEIMGNLLSEPTRNGDFLGD